MAIYEIEFQETKLCKCIYENARNVKFLCYYEVEEKDKTCQQEEIK